MFVLAMGRAGVFAGNDRLLNVLTIGEIIGEAAVVLDKTRTRFHTCPIFVVYIYELYNKVIIVLCRNGHC